MWVSCTKRWGCPWAIWEESQVSPSSGSWMGFDGVQEAFNNLWIHIPSVTSATLPASSSALSSAAHDSVLWMGWKRNDPLGLHLTLAWGILSTILMLSLSPSEKSWSRVVSWALMCAALGGVMQVKSNCPSFPFRCIQIHTYVFFNLQQFDRTIQLIPGLLQRLSHPWI